MQPGQESLNILYLNPTSRMSGAEFSLLSLFRKIDRRRFNPILLLPEEGGFSNKTRELGIETLTLPGMIRYGEGYRFYKLPEILATLFKMRQLLIKKKIRLVHSNSPRSSYLGGMAARLSLVPSITHVRDIHLSPFSHPLKALFLGCLADEIIAVSSATKDSIIKTRPSLKSKINVVYNGVDIERLDNTPLRDARVEFGIAKDVPVIGSVGIIHPAKGQDVLIKVAALTKKSFPSLKVLIIGDTFLEQDKNYKNELERLVKELDLEENVIFTGFREDVFDLISTLDVMIHPATYAEPFPRSIIEASALKKPIVATKVGGITEILDNDKSALLVEPSDPISMAKAVVSLLKDREKAASLALQARRKVENDFNIAMHVKNIAKIYERVLGISS